MPARSIAKGPRRFTGQPTRLQTHAANNLGVIYGGSAKSKYVFREAGLDVLDAYYENRQYDDLMNWEEAAKQEPYVPVRNRKPRIIYNVAKVLVDKVASKLIGSQVFPTFVVEDEPDDTQFFRIVSQACDFRRGLLQPTKHALISGACFVRFYLVDGHPILEHFNAKYCYPVFDAVGELDFMEVRYVFDDPDDKDSNGNPKKKWYRLTLGKLADVLYDNPEYKEGGSLPDFTPVEENQHGLGWVQGEWLRTSKQKFSPDGDGLCADILGFIDDLNYSLSQSSQAVGYNQEPQLTVNGIDESELENLIKSSQKAWDLGREGKAQFVETNLNGVKEARETRNDNRQKMLDVVRVVLHDPEKMVANAQSGRAMEILNAPLVELIDELRTVFEPSIKNLLIKISLTMLVTVQSGGETVLEVPAGYAPKSLDITLQWPAIYPLTLQDIQMKITAASAATTAKIMSREWATRWIAQDVGIENVEEELQRISAEPELNPFGSFGGGM